MSKEILITIPGQSGSAGKQPDRTKGRAVFSIGNRGPFAFSVPFVLKTHPNVGDSVPQLRFSRMNHNNLMLQHNMPQDTSLRMGKLGILGATWDEQYIWVGRLRLGNEACPVDVAAQSVYSIGRVRGDGRCVRRGDIHPPVAISSVSLIYAISD